MKKRYVVPAMIMLGSLGLVGCDKSSEDDMTVNSEEVRDELQLNERAQELNEQAEEMANEVSDVAQDAAEQAEEAAQEAQEAAQEAMDDARDSMSDEE